MKKVSILMLLFFIPAVSTVAAKLPKGTYLWSEFETAKSEAIKEKKPILYVFTDLKTT